MVQSKQRAINSFLIYKLNTSIFCESQPSFLLRLVMPTTAQPPRGVGGYRVAKR